jgi:hypothetical protein
MWGLAAGALLGTAACRLNEGGTGRARPGPVNNDEDAGEVADARLDVARDVRAGDARAPDAGIDALVAADAPSVDGAPADARGDRLADLPAVDPPRDAPVEARSAVVMRINVAGPTHVGLDYPGVWTADPGAGGVCRPTFYLNAAPINGTRDDALFHGEMYGNPVTCAVGTMLPRGTYQVNLYFAEIFWGPGCPGGGPGVGARVFDILLENVSVATNVDIFREAGCAASELGTGRPVVKRFTTAINDGTLNINLNAHANNANITAIEVLSMF